MRYYSEAFYMCADLITFGCFTTGQGPAVFALLTGSLNHSSMYHKELRSGRAVSAPDVGPQGRGFESR